MKKELLSIKEKAFELGVSVVTLRRWDKLGWLLPNGRTLGGHRRYAPVEDPKASSGEGRKSVGYARVSTRDQLNDLLNQKKLLEESQTDVVLSDIGSGLNFNKPSFKKLLLMILRHEVKEVVLTRKDRWIRFGYPLLETLCSYFNVSIRLLFEEETCSYEETFAKDVVEIIQVFCSRLYGRRSHSNKKRLKADLLDKHKEILIPC